jgi:hypothetical protein
VARERPGLRVWVVPLEMVLPAVFIRRVLDALGPVPAR